MHKCSVDGSHRYFFLNSIYRPLDAGLLRAGFLDRISVAHDHFKGGAALLVIEKSWMSEPVEGFLCIYRDFADFHVFTLFCKIPGISPTLTIDYVRPVTTQLHSNSIEFMYKAGKTLERLKMSTELWFGSINSLLHIERKLLATS